ncbi:non-specific lipid transfer protein GPI-anchored 14-like [Diospyros lotus]|uniref:non-specific lipid transfer protein GPI-anchored 14-like n=1 Tax=Diospyros lotus TaxID=55363 RepID=UPI00224FC7C1|nr:non-specific lipid transfer protein GPI-anchored 14-like [Diospyros lotus]
MGKKKLTLLSALVAMLAVVAVATMQEDEQECADQLTNLAACIPFVCGTAQKPTQQCCQDTQKVKSAKPKCLCVLIKESTEPYMGLPVTTTLALQMPSKCNIDAKVSDCPCNFSSHTFNTQLKIPVFSL